MNQPTREEHEELKKRVAKLERQTEPIRITKLEIDSGSIFRQLDEVQEDVGVLKIQMEGVRADISAIRATQSDHTVFLVEHGRQLKEIEEKQDAHAELLGQLINVGEDHTKRFDRIDTSIAGLKLAQAEQGKRMDAMDSKLDLILTLLQPRLE